MINRISEIPFWGPEEQIRRFINQHDERIPEGETQQTITQQRIEKLDEIYQKQLIWSYGLRNVDDAYFYQDWCPIGEHTSSTEDPKWQMELWGEAVENLQRAKNRSFDYRTFVGFQKSKLHGDEMPKAYDAAQDEHAKESDIENGNLDPTDLDVDTLRHNIMRSYIEVSEWLGDGATQYGSHNGYVSRKMSMAWLFNAIKALINWKLANNDKWAEVDIHPLDIGGVDEHGNPRKDSQGNVIRERFLLTEAETSTQGKTYDDAVSLDQKNGCCAFQEHVRAKDPDKNGVQKVRGNEYHYGERAWFYTHNSFIGECRFFHNARFLGQTTFDKEINGTAMRSRWADLAEYKESDEQYEPGTLVMFGGEKEVTISRNGVANAVVTTKPGLVLNGDESSQNCTMVGIVLTGTAPVKISCAVKKFDKLVADEQFPGHARPRKWWEFWKKPIAITLESWPAGGKVNCITKMEF